MHQRCPVHYQRNTLRTVSSERLHLVNRQELRDAWTAPTRLEAAQRSARRIAELRPDAPRLPDWQADMHDATLACYVLERDDVRERLRSTNSLERHQMEGRRRTREIRTLPHEARLLRILSALAIEQNDSWRAQRCLVRPTFIAPAEPMQKTAQSRRLPVEYTNNWT